MHGRSSSYFIQASLRFPIETTHTLKTRRNDDWLSKGFISATALLSNLLTKEVLDKGLLAEPRAGG